MSQRGGGKIEGGSHARFARCTAQGWRVRRGRYSRRSGQETTHRGGSLWERGFADATARRRRQAVSGENRAARGMGETWRARSANRRQAAPDGHRGGAEALCVSDGEQ